MGPRFREHHLTLTAAGVAFYAFLSLIPGLAAVVSVYGLVADRDEVEEHVRRSFSVFPADARRLLATELSRIVDKPSGTLGGSFVVAAGVALWSASKGVGHLLDGVALAYGSAGHGFARRRALAFVGTVGAIVVGVGAAIALTVLPDQAPDGPVRWGVHIALGIGLAVLALVGLALVYRFGPGRDRPHWTWVAPGSLVALVLLVLMTVGLNVYVSNVKSYDTYGALAGVVLLMLWLHLGALIILLGAELNADLERQE
jgi:membrane protein